MRLCLALLACSLVSCGKFEPRALTPKDFPACKESIKWNKIADFESFETVFSSGKRSEMISCLPNTYPHSYVKLPIYGVRLTNLKQGDIILVWSEAEFTNDFDTDFMVAGEIIINSIPERRGSQPITDANGYNITPGMHHGVMVKIGVYRITRDLPEVYLVQYVWAADGRYFEPSFLKVEQGYGRLSGLVIRSDTWINIATKLFNYL